MNVKAHTSIWGYLYHEGKQTLTHGMGDLDMNGYKIINLDEPRKKDQAATARYVANYVSHLNNVKLEKAGDSMSGILDMDHNKITNVGAPTDETDVANKQYVDAVIQHIHNFDIYTLGPYVVIPEQDGVKNYISFKSKKNVDIDDNLLVEVKNSLDDITENEFNANSQDITITSDVSLLPNPRKSLGFMELNSELRIDFRPTSQLSPPWTFIFSAQPGDSAPRSNNASIISFYNPNNQHINYISTMWTSTSFKYAITRDIMNLDNTIKLNLDTSVLNHIAFEYAGNKLTVWLNGKSRKMHNIELGNISDVRMGVKQLGLLSLYNRELNKQEIIEHFVMRHVKNFTNDEILD